MMRNDVTRTILQAGFGVLGAVYLRKDEVPFGRKVKRGL
jgi:hypothetical protein